MACAAWLFRLGWGFEQELTLFDVRPVSYFHSGLLPKMTPMGADGETFACFSICGDLYCKPVTRFCFDKRLLNRRTRRTQSQSPTGVVGDLCGLCDLLLIVWLGPTARVVPSAAP